MVMQYRTRTPCALPSLMAACASSERAVQLGEMLYGRSVGIEFGLRTPEFHRARARGVPETACWRRVSVALRSCNCPGAPPLQRWGSRTAGVDSTPPRLKPWATRPARWC